MAMMACACAYVACAAATTPTTHAQVQSAKSEVQPKTRGRALSETHTPESWGQDPWGCHPGPKPAPQEGDCKTRKAPPSMQCVRWITLLLGLPGQKRPWFDNVLPEPNATAPDHPAATPGRLRAKA